MTTQLNVSKTDAVATLQIAGRFDFKIQREFRAAYTALLQDAAIKTLRIDLSRTEYVDSSALGLMMLLRERAQEAGKVVSLAGASDTVRRVIVLANFDKVFKME